MGDSKLCSLREQLGNSRTKSYGVVRCRFVFGKGWLNSLLQNPAYKFALGPPQFANTGSVDSG